MRTYGEAVAQIWPALIVVFGESISHDPDGIATAYSATLVFDDGDAIKAQKSNRISALISGPRANFTTTPGERDTFTRGTAVYSCVEVEDDKIGGWKCWCRLKS